MLAPRGTSAFVCLRCEAHLARPRPRPRFASFPSSRHFSASTRRHDGATELEAAVSEQSLKIDTTNSWKPRGSSRRRKVRENHATSASLGVQRLGEEARVLVLKEKLRDSSEEPEATDVIPQEAEPVDIPDILASLDQEQKVLTPEELNQLIAGLRPKSDGDPNDPTYVTQANFAKLSSVLADGFTFQQMSGFYSAAKSIPQPVAKEDSVESVGKDKKPSVRAPRRTEWQAGVTDLKTRMSRNKGQGRAVNKQVLADRILRDIWHLVTMEEIEAAGQLEMSLTEEQLNILSQSDGESILDQIGRKRRAKIEIYQNQNAKQHVIRITADKTTSEYVADDIDQCLQNLNSKQIDLAPWLKMGTPLGNYMGKPVDIEKKVLFSKENLDAIAKLTRTTLIRDWSKINIFGLDEHAIAEAERNILRSLPLHDGVKRSVYARLYKSLDKATSSSLPVPEERNASLNAEDRHTQHFGRKVLPISRASSSSPASDDAPVTDLLSKAKKEKLITEAIFQMRLKTTLPQLTEEVKDWIPEPEVSLSADFGQLLYPRSDSVFEPGSRFALFSPSIPGLANILTSPCFSATSRLGPPSLTYTFVPKFPNLASISNRAHFPTLSIQMRAGHAGIRPTLHKLSLAFHQRTHSILLPSHATDLRLRFAAQLRLKKDHADPHITSWTNDVIANIESGARLTAPPELTIPIPHVIIPGEELTATGTRNVDFVFTGIHFRQSVSGTMRDTAISYRTVQAGKSTFQDVQDRLHARAGMLSAHFGSASSSSSSSFSAANIAADLKDETKLRNWFHTILDICGDIGTAAAQKAPVGKKAVPRHEDGERKRRREMERAKAGEDGKEMKGGEQDEKEIESEEHSEKAGHEGGAEEKVTETATETEIQSQPQPEQSPSEIPEDLAPEQEGRRA